MNELGHYPAGSAVRPLDVAFDDARSIVVDILDLFVGNIDEGNVVKIPLLVVQFMEVERVVQNACCL